MAAPKARQTGPAIDLHCHLDGALRPETIYELARERGLIGAGATPADIAERMRVPANNPDLISYLKTFELPIACLQTKEALERAAFEFVLDRAAEGLVYVETRFAPSQHLAGRLRLDDVVEAVLAGLERGQAAGTVAVRLILCAMRHLSPAAAVETAELVKAYAGRGVVAFDLAGDEKNYPPQLFHEAFSYCRQEGLNVTIHAGESAGPESIRAAVALGAARIGHGVCLGDDPGLLREVAARQIGLEMCPTSNIQTGAVASYAAFPIFSLLEQGVRATVCTDNPTCSDTTLAREYDLLIDAHAPGQDLLAQLFDNAEAMAFDFAGASAPGVEQTADGSDEQHRRR